MKSFKRITSAAFVVILLTIGFFRAAFQIPENNHVSVQFTVTRGRNNNFVYRLPNDLTSWQRLLPILDHAVPMVTSLTGTAWNAQIVIVFMGVSATDQYVSGRMMPSNEAYITRLESATLFDPEICQIRIFKGWESAPNFETLFVRELFHCL